MARYDDLFIQITQVLASATYMKAALLALSLHLKPEHAGTCLCSVLYVLRKKNAMAIAGAAFLHSCNKNFQLMHLSHHYLQGLFLSSKHRVVFRLWTWIPDALLFSAQAAYLYVILERAGVQPAKATPAQMKAMAQQLAEISPQAPNVPPIEEHLSSLGMNATAPEPVASIAQPPAHHWETARRTLEQPASVTFRGLLLNADEVDGSQPEDFSSLVSLRHTVGHDVSCSLYGTNHRPVSVGASEDHIDVDLQQRLPVA